MNCEKTIIFMMTLSVINFFIGRRSVLFPPFIYSTIWFMDVMIFALSPFDLNTVHAITWWVISIGALIFCVGGWATCIFPNIIYASRVKELCRPTQSSFGLTVLVIICIYGAIIMFCNIYEHGGGGGFSQIMMNARNSSISMSLEGQSHSMIVANIPVLSIWVVLICMIDRRKRLFIVALICSIICCVLSTGRTDVLMLFASILSVQLFMHHKDNMAGLLRYGMLPIVSFVALFVGLVFMNKDISVFQDTSTVLLNFVLAYLVVSIPALDYVVRHPIELLHAPHHTFALVSSVLSYMGISVSKPSAIDLFTFVPLPTNVYTIYKFYITDFGIIGCFACIFTIGFLQTYIFRLAKNGGRISVYICAILVFPAVMSVFDDAYSGCILIVIKAGLLATLYWGVLNRIHYGIRMPKIIVKIWSTHKRVA